jgi:hypothetical protein
MKHRCGSKRGRHKTISGYFFCGASVINGFVPDGKPLALSKIVSSLKHSKKMSYSKKSDCRFYETAAEWQDVKIKPVA